MDRWMDSKSITDGGSRECWCQDALSAEATDVVQRQDSPRSFVCANRVDKKVPETSYALIE